MKTAERLKDLFNPITSAAAYLNIILSGVNSGGRAHMTID